MNTAVMSPCSSFRPALEENSGVHRRKYKRYAKGTYVGLLAYILQDSPNKMLTFRQIMERLGVFVAGDRKGLENNIRVCLSSNKCFVKVPVDPDYPNARRNFWKVEESCITPKMLRRHFKDMTDMLPSLEPQCQVKCDTGAALDPPSPASISKENTQPVKFSSSFSIESLLKNDHSAHLRIPPVQDRGGLNDLRLTPAAGSSVCWERSVYSFTQSYYMYSSAAAGLSGIPAVRKSLSAAHEHALYPSQLSSYHSQTVQSRISASPPLPHDLRYLRW
ncbi:forkhead box protein H1 [Astyanax mexicanus]|nr:forkhead box protein H1 [Astyanax mexicanus]